MQVLFFNLLTYYMVTMLYYLYTYHILLLFDLIFYKHFIWKSHGNAGVILLIYIGQRKIESNKGGQVVRLTTGEPFITQTRNK